MYALDDDDAVCIFRYGRLTYIHTYCCFPDHALFCTSLHLVQGMVAVPPSTTVKVLHPPPSPSSRARDRERKEKDLRLSLPWVVLIVAVLSPSPTSAFQPSLNRLSSHRASYRLLSETKCIRDIAYSHCCSTLRYKVRSTVLNSRTRRYSYLSLRGQIHSADHAV